MIIFGADLVTSVVGNNGNAIYATIKSLLRLFRSSRYKKRNVYVYMALMYLLII